MSYFVASAKLIHFLDWFSLSKKSLICLDLLEPYSFTYPRPMNVYPPPPPAPAPPAQGLDRKSLLLLSDYLGFYEQRTKIGCSFSEWVEVIWVTPQGSVLGPLRFNIFINDIFLMVEKWDICNFAKNNTIYSCGSDLP